jgi:predicted Zn finger-like uncharacterized protein
MPNPKQSNLPVSKTEREVLDLAKQEYERRRNGHADWGEFLTSMALRFLATAGILTVMATMLQNQQTSYVVQCPHCGSQMRIAYRGMPPAAELIKCLYCPQQFIVQYRPW